MKRIFLTLTLASMLLVPALAQAQQGGRADGLQPGEARAAARSSGGFTGPNASLTTVAEALKMENETRVTLVGKIETRLGHEKYRFSDGTGSIELDISDKRWRGLEVSPEDTVEVVGEIDLNAKGVEVDVKRITKK